jgi:hypothetical protein
LHAVQDGITWSTTAVSPGASHLVLWVKGLGENADRANVAVFLNDTRTIVEYVAAESENGARQVNARVVETVPRGGTLRVTVGYAGTMSNAVEIGA